MKFLALLLALAWASGCKTNSSQTNTQGNNPPQPDQANLTGTWQGTIDGGEVTLLQYVLIEDAGTLIGVKFINDPLNAAYFHNIDTLAGTHSGSSVVLQTSLTADTIRAVFDGGSLAGVDPFSEPLIFRDGGSYRQWNMLFVLTRISTSATFPDAGTVQ